MARLTPEELEAKMHALLREQPPRRAPRSLEQRVLAEIARREALPWWQKNIMHWPLLVQVAFLLVSVGVVAAAGLAAVTIFADQSLGAAVRLTIQPAISAWETFRAAGVALADVVRGWIPTIPPLWLYLGLGAIGTAYAMLLGLGATLYRFWLQPQYAARSASI